MKSILILILSLLTFTSLSAQSDRCENSYMPLTEGAFMQLTHYNKKGKVESITEQKITDIESTDEGYKANMEFTSMDKKGKEQTSGSFTFECRSGIIYMDMSHMFDQSQLGNIENAEAEITGTDLQIPNDLIAGQELPDSEMEIKTSVGGFGNFNMTVHVEDRKVEAIETITTPAGSFKCAKISQTTHVKTIMNMTTSSINWYAKGIGTVRTENYDQRGNLIGYMELTEFKK